ncbi:MAG: hypothetical protein ACFCUG_12350 [Thiotrichales bacterium]
MLRFLPGIILLQAVCVGLVVLLTQRLDSSQGWLQLGIVLLLIAVLAAFWFNSIACHIGADRLADAHQNFAREREKLKVNAERAKLRVVERTHKQTLKEVSRAHAKANLKVGAALAGVAGAGVLMLFTQFITVGLLTLAGTGGVAVGYLIRARHDAARLAQNGTATPALTPSATPMWRRLPRLGLRVLKRDDSV